MRQGRPNAGLLSGASIADALLAAKEQPTDQLPSSTLAQLAPLCNADGCVVWLWTEQEQEARLFSAATWFDGDWKPSFQYCSRDSITHLHAVTGTPFNVDELHYHSHEEKYHNLSDGGTFIRCYCTIPVSSQESVPAKYRTCASVNFYKSSSSQFTRDEFELAQRLGPLIFQYLNEAARRSTADLRQSVTAMLQAHEMPLGDSELFLKWAKNELTKVADNIKSGFRCLEVSIYLDDGSAEDQIGLFAGGWPWQTKQAQFYRSGDGLTGYCFETGRTVFIFDLRQFQKDPTCVLAEYSGVTWTRAIDVEEPVLGQVQMAETKAPFSFVATPIRDKKDKILGVMRCSVIEAVPYYFSQLQRSSLEQIAGEIGHWYGYALRLHQEFEEREWLETYVDNISNLNERAHDLSSGQKLEMSNVMRQALATLRAAIPSAHSFVIRLVDDAKTELRFNCSLPDPHKWPARDAGRIGAPLPLHGFDANSVAAEAYRANNIQPVSDFRESRFPKIAFANTNALVVAPISSNREKYGTIEARFIRSKDLTGQSMAVLKLLGSQIGLFFFLGDRIEREREHKREKQRSLDIQRDAFEFLEHQLYTSLSLAHMKVRALLSKGIVAGSQEAIELQGLIRRAEKVSASVELFNDLAAEKPLNVHLKVATAKEVIERLKQAACEYESLWRKKRLRFEVLTEKLDVLSRQTVCWDWDLLEQVIDNLLDNAGKYSVEATTVTVSGGVTHAGKIFFLSISNKNFHVTPAKAQSLMERGKRTNEAILSGHRGSGLGLYLVKRLLEAQTAKLEVIPSDSRGIVDFRLLFPVGLRGQ